MVLTRGGLKPAKITKEGGADPTINFMFNPTEYSISKTNDYSPGNKVAKDTPETKFQQGHPVELSLTIWFDTYNDGYDAEDVRKYTDPLYKLMEVDPAKHAPPIMEFWWADTMILRGVITSLRQKFTLFKHDGTPVRTSVDLSIKQKVKDDGSTDDDSFSLATAAGKPWPQKVVTKTADASLWSIAAKVTGNPDFWKNIAEASNIEDPLKIKNGTSIQVPKK